MSEKEVLILILAGVAFVCGLIAIINVLNRRQEKVNVPDMPNIPPPPVPSRKLDPNRKRGPM